MISPKAFKARAEWFLLLVGIADDVPKNTISI
jgi:hypothetical protein